MDLQENLQQVEANICKACENAGRKRSDVTLIAVSKTKPIEMLQTVYDLGPRDFGENKVQEMCEKMEVLPKDIRWHMIGHLQTNKVKYIVGKTELIHSVDSLHLAKEIEKQAAKQNFPYPPDCRFAAYPNPWADDDCTIRGKSGRQPHLLPADSPIIC